MTLLLVTDLDGTIIDSRGALYEGAHMLVEVARANHWRLAFASARPLSSLTRVTQRLRAADSFLAAFQGALVLGPDPRSRHVLASHRLDPSAVNYLRVLVGDRWPLWWYTETTWYVNRVTQAAQLEAAVLGCNYVLATDAPLSEAVYKVLVIAPEETEVQELVAACPDIRTHISKAGYNEVVSTDVSLDKGLSAVIAGEPGIGRVIAIGDGLNDVGLLTRADVGVTFADAPDRLLAVADLVLPADRVHALRLFAAELKSRAQRDPAISL